MASENTASKNGWGVVPKDPTPVNGGPIQVKHDGALAVSIGGSRFEKKWENAEWKWSQLVDRLRDSKETPETHAEFIESKEQDDIKDVGGFVGGHLKEGHRGIGFVDCRQVLTLDLDFPPQDLWEQIEGNNSLNYAKVMYSTHKHTPEKPRLRLVIPIDRKVSPDEYEAIARKVAEEVGIDYCDDSTFQPERLMYWPSNSCDVEPVFKFKDGPFLQADEILGKYKDWKDTSSWPRSSRVGEVRKRQAKEAGDPLKKDGIIGAFCRTYTIPGAIAKFLSDVYEPAGREDRYTYKNGSSVAGLAIIDDVFAYSHHSTDPARGRLCNAFDLVRIHKYGHMDSEKNKEEQPGEWPSQKAMIELARKDPGVVGLLTAEKMDAARTDFEKPKEITPKLTKSGDFDTRYRENLRFILETDERLQKIAYNSLTKNIETAGELPWDRPGAGRVWSSVDAQCLIEYVDRNYAQFSPGMYDNTLLGVASKRAYNPVKEYLENLPEWDGVKRVETLLVDYLGAQDTPYTREATRKMLLAAVARIYNPGCKFDYMMVLIGDQGIGKSTLIGKLGADWYTDNLKFDDMRGKTAAEQIKGYWIVEIGELAGAKKADVETVKAFLSRQKDIYRGAYRRDAEEFPRVCVLFGTSNKDDFLIDETGNRRFWPIPCSGTGDKTPWDLDAETVEQIWAEVMVMSRDEKGLTLSPESERTAKKMQESAMRQDPRRAEVLEFLDAPITNNWYEVSTESRADVKRAQRSGDTSTISMYLGENSEFNAMREKVCAQEIYLEGMGGTRREWANNAGTIGRDIAKIMATIDGWEKKQGRHPAGYGSVGTIWERVGEKE